MNTKDLKSFFESIRPDFSGQIEFDAPLAKATYYQIGGSADVLVTPKTQEDLQKIHQALHVTGSRFFILGWGSNLLVSDDGFRGVVIRMKHLFQEIEIKEEGLLRLGASVGGSSLLRRAQREGWSGLSALTGIPGSVGGMVTMNAGTHLGEFKDVAVSVDYIDLRSNHFEIERHRVGGNSFSYRKNHFLTEDQLVTHAEVRFGRDDPKKIEAEINHLYTRRKETQPVDFPSCGSVFMNPKSSGLHAWQVIDRLKLRGHRIGNAQFAEKHSNFIINLGGARAVDVKGLIDLAKSRALNELNVELHEEVRYIT